MLPLGTVPGGHEVAGVGVGSALVGGLPEVAGSFAGAEGFAVGGTGVAGPGFGVEPFGIDVPGAATHVTPPGLFCIEGCVLPGIPGVAGAFPVGELVPGVGASGVCVPSPAALVVIGVGGPIVVGGGVMVGLF